MHKHPRKKIALALAIGTAATLAAVGIGQPANASTSSSMPVGNVTSNGRTWHQVYKQDFSTPAARGQFLQKYPSIAAYNGYRDTSGRGVYDPADVLSVANGVLDFDLHTSGGVPRVASISPDDYASMTTGRYSVRFKTSHTSGYKFVGMFWPSNDWWNEGEIDWPEADLGLKPRPASAIPGTLGWGTGGAPVFAPGYQDFASSDTTGWHTATTEWDHGAVRFYWDGKLLLTTTQAVPDSPMRVQLQAETAIDQPAPSSSSVGHVDIDWISIWK